MCLFILNPLHAQADRQNCRPSQSSLYSWIETKLVSSPHSELIPLNCDELKTIEDYRDEEIQITSGRKRGQFVVCLSNTKETPCQHKIAQLIGYEAPSILLGKIFGSPQTSPDYLNETVERLFLKPSKLIKRQ